MSCYKNDYIISLIKERRHATGEGNLKSMLLGWNDENDADGGE